MTVFIDTSALFALLSRTDAKHGDAAAYWNQVLDKSEVQLVTSNYIVIETCALLRNRLGMKAVDVLLRDILPALTIIWVDEITHFAATEAMLTAGNRGPSLVDCSSFAIMDSKGIMHAFAYDQHFSAHGFIC